MKQFFKSLVIKLVQLTGVKFSDAKTNQVLARAWVWPWKGKIHILSVSNRMDLEVEFVPRPDGVFYTHHMLQLRPSSPPDVPSLLAPPPSVEPKPLFVILYHLSEENWPRIRDYWEQVIPQGSEIIMAYGGKRSEYEKFQNGNRVFVEDPRLRLKNHPVERQTQVGVYRAVTAWIRENGKAFTHVWFFEFDHWPVQRGFAETILSRMIEERADVLTPAIWRVNHTQNANWLYHQTDADNAGWPENMSLREDKSAAFSMSVTGLLWRYDAWEKVADYVEPFNIYVEISLGLVDK